MFEWDEDKRLANVAKHGVDFAIVPEIFEGEYAEGKDGRNTAEEARHLAIGAFERRSYVVAFTWRGENRRIISAWEVGERGRKRYQTILARRSS